MKIGLWLAMLALVFPTLGTLAQSKTREALNNPASLKDKAPATFQAQFETTQGVFIVDVTRAWSPNGADRFYNLVKYGFFDGIKFFRIVPNFVVQFGIHGDPAIATKWTDATIPDDKVEQSNKRGFLTFAKSSAPNSRTTQLFINLADNARLDAIGFSAFGKVSKGMDVVDKLYSGYGEQITALQDQITQGGNKYLEANWPKLDGIKKATLYISEPVQTAMEADAGPLLQLVKKDKVGFSARPQDSSIDDKYVLSPDGSFVHYQGETGTRGTYEIEGGHLLFMVGNRVEVWTLQQKGTVLRPPSGLNGVYGAYLRD